MYHYILLFINKVLYYIRIPLYTLKILFVILWLWLCDWWIKPPPAPPKKSLPRPLRKEGSAYAHTRDKGQGSLSDSFLQNTCELALPSFRRGRGRLLFVFYYLSVKQTITKPFAELVTPVPPKTIAFWIKLLTFANREQKPHPTSPKGEEASLQVFCRNYLKKSQEPLSSYVRIGTPPPSGRLGGAPPPREGRSADREIAPKSFRS